MLSNWKRRVAQLAAAVFCCSLFTISVSAVGTAAETKTIRVGYPLQAGLTEYSEEDGYSGYTYDYLQEIAQYTGWEYEFVRVGDSGEELLVLMEQLIAGEIDVIGGLAYNEKTAGLLEYTDETYCTAYTVLAAQADNVELTTTNYRTYPDLGVGTLESYTTMNSTLEADLKKLGMTADIHSYASEEERQAALDSGEIELVVTNSLKDIDGMGLKTIKRFDAKSYFFATTPGNVEVEAEINRVLQSLNTTSYFSQQTVAEQNFPSGMTAERSWTQEELTYMEAAESLQVLVSPDLAPYYLQQQDVSGGIVAELLTLLAGETGLSFSVPLVEDSVAYEEAIQQNRMELLAPVVYDVEHASENGYYLSHPILQTKMGFVTNEKYTGNVETVAVLSGYPTEGELLKGKKIKLVTTVAECLALLKNDTVQAVYAPIYPLEYQLQQFSYRHFTMEETDAVVELSLAIVGQADPVLMSILNKGISRLDDRQVQQIVYEQTLAMPTQFWVEKLFLQYPLWFFAGAALLLAGMVGILLSVILPILRRKRLIAVQKEQYQAIKQLMNQPFYWYDCVRDTMLLPQQVADQFGMLSSQKKFLSMMKQNPNLFGGLHKEWTKLLKYRRSTEGLQCKCTLPSGKEIIMILTQKCITHKKKTIALVGTLSQLETRASNTEEPNQSEKEVQGSVFAVCIDHIEQLRAEQGEQVYDQHLQLLVKSLLSEFSKSEIVGLLEGGEFLIWLQQEVDHQKLAVRANRLFDGFAKRVKGQEYSADTLSIGICVAEQPESFEALCRKADRALAIAKAKEQNYYYFYQA